MQTAKTAEIGLAVLVVILLILTVYYASLYGSEVAKYNALSSSVTASSGQSSNAELAKLSSMYNQTLAQLDALKQEYSNYTKGIGAYQNNSALLAAYQHWNNIAIENTSLIMSNYQSNAVLHWIGGPLSGNYTGYANISKVWNKFNNLYEYVVWYAVNPPTVSSVSADTYKVVAPLQFVVFPFPTSSNPKPHELVLNVTETLYMQYNTTTYASKIYNETWKVAPISISSVATGYQPSIYSNTTGNMTA
ncbi:MAG: hypothetical protein ARM1_0238 [Candidatus Micrarchaeota archaeon]|nr:MAG: hypothetical protein ARM1_0238 [Candidatus Micrarchaeota archaeon]